MSVSQLARAGRIDTEASRLTKQASTINSQLNAMVNEVLAFAAFMHTDPRVEFSQADRDKYSDDFASAMGELQATLAQLAPLAGIEQGTVTVADFLAGYTGDINAYSTRFDKG